MGKRWAAILLLLAVLPLAALAHKSPVVEYTYVGHIWEEAYTTNPRQVVIGEPVTFMASVIHPNETIEGNISAVIAVYEDDTVWEWFGGKSYKRPDWQVLMDTSMRPAPGIFPMPVHNEPPNEFTQSITIERPGTYQVYIDWYQDRQYIGQSMHNLDVEQRGVGPLYLIGTIIIVLAILVGVRRGIL